MPKLKRFRKQDSKMSLFVPIANGDDIKEVIKTAFDADLPVAGSWGYTQEAPTIILQTSQPLTQLEHMLASMRSYIEMNMTLPPQERYGSINLNESNRVQIQSNHTLYDKVSYEITAMKEETYNAFIQEYKEGLGNEGFDIADHFARRKAATLTREVTYWFAID
ncbi:MAG: hypothetical protein RLZZ428_239 [Pseudomonadota bacterium]